MTAMNENTEKSSVMAFVVSANRMDSGRLDVEGFVMFVSDDLAKEIGTAGRCLADFLDIDQELPVMLRPGLFTWEGSVTFTDDDFFTCGEWRMSCAREIIKCSKGENPFEAKAVPDTAGTTGSVIPVDQHK